MPPGQQPLRNWMPKTSSKSLFGRLDSSFRDPAGFVVQAGGVAYRVITDAGRADYDGLMASGLYEALTQAGVLIKHVEVEQISGFIKPKNTYKLLKPDQVPFISYPYEWSFSQLKDAALVTLAAQKSALEHDQVLKDASAYNVQFVAGRPVLIDSLSFEPYTGQRVWSAYRQFCQHFLAPLALMAYSDVRLNLMLRDYIDGLPLDLAVKLLPTRRRYKPSLMLHLAWHSAANRRKPGQGAESVQSIRQTNNPAHKRALLGLADSLERAVKGLSLPQRLQTEWGKYYDDTNYSPAAFKHKQQLVGEYVGRIKPTSVWDLGGNDGSFSRVAIEAGAASAICFDIDPLAVDKSYQLVKAGKLERVLPLRSDLTNPSPGLGWANRERESLASRAPQNNLVMALALVHHLTIGNNLPFSMLARYFSELGEHLIVEFIPKTDSKVQILLSTRPDIFPDYDQAHFEAAFAEHYRILAHDQVKGSQRTLYLMQRR